MSCLEGYSRLDACKVVNRYLADLFVKRDDLRAKLEKMGVNCMTNYSFLNLQLELYITIRQIGILDALVSAIMKSGLE